MVLGDSEAWSSVADLIVKHLSENLQHDVASTNRMLAGSERRNGSAWLALSRARDVIGAGHATAPEPLKPKTCAEKKHLFQTASSTRQHAFTNADASFGAHPRQLQRSSHRYKVSQAAFQTVTRPTALSYTLSLFPTITTHDFFFPALHCPAIVSGTHPYRRPF
jgi:hypothetical protein